MRKTEINFDSVTDDELAVLAQQGDQKAYNELCLRFLDFKKVRGRAGYYESDDLLQEGMFGFMNAVKSFSPEHGVPFMAYAAICVNNCIKSVINKTNSRSYIPVAERYEESDTFERLPGPAEFVEGTENAEHIWQLCECELSATEKTVLVCIINGLTVAETCEKLGISKKSAENALMRARKKLREILG